MKPQSNYKLFIRATAILNVCVGLGVMAGWLFDIEPFKWVIPGLPTMKFNTALCIALCGTVLWLGLYKSRRPFVFQIIFSAIIFLFALISFSETIFHYNTGLDQLFVTDNESFAAFSNYPGRMAVLTAASFMLLAVSFSLIKARSKTVKIITQFMLHIITVIAFIAIMGYLYRIPIFYKLSFLTSMAMHTAVLFFFTSIAASFFNHSIGVTGLFTGGGMGSIMARKIFPLIATILLILGFLRVQSHRLNIVSVEFGGALYTIAFLLVSLLIIGITAVQLNNIDKKRKEAEESLKGFNKNLEHIIDQRTQHIRAITNRLSLATKASNIGIWDWDVTNNILVWDEQMYRLYGIEPSSFEGVFEAWEKGVHPEDIEKANVEMQKAIDNNKDLDLEFRVIWPDKSIHYIKGNAFIDRDENGNATRMVGTNWDITEQMEQLEKIRQSKEQYHNMVTGVQDYAIMLLDKDGYIKTWNKGAEKIKGYKEEEILGSSSRIFYTAEDLNRHWWETLLEQARKNGRASDRGWRVAKDGHLFWAHVVINSLYGPDGEITGFTKLTSDLTELKKAEDIIRFNEERLREQEEKMRLFVKHTPAAVAMFDNEIRYIIASDKWYADYKLEGQDIIGKCHYDIFPEIRNMPEWLDIHQRCLKGAVEINDESPFSRPDGKTDWLHWEIHPWKKHDGFIGGIIMFTEVITDKVIARETLKKLNKKLLASNKELEQFAYAASHDLQEPLRTVKSFVQLLEKKYKSHLDETAAKYIHFAVDGVDRMKILIGDLLDFSRIGKSEQELTFVNIATVLENTKLILKSLLEENGAVIIYPDSLPVIRANDLQIKQIFQNLITNGIKYRGEENPVIEVGYTEDDDFWQFFVKDNGIGISPKYFDKIFILFQRLHGKATHSGTGIGLATCKKIAEKHGGSIWLESVEGKGSAFYFTISKQIDSEL
ncbi:MAG: PAS domain S-box protein [Ferruginibacter sp.]